MRYNFPASERKRFVSRAGQHNDEMKEGAANSKSSILPTSALKVKVKEESIPSKNQSLSRYPIQFTDDMAITRMMFRDALQRCRENKKEFRGLDRKQCYEFFYGVHGPRAWFPSESTQIFFDMFDTLDKEGKNLISVSDVLRFFYPNSPPAEIEQRRLRVEDFEYYDPEEEPTSQRKGDIKELHETRVSELVDVFRVYDRRGTGRLTAEDFVAAVQALWEFPPPAEEIRAFFSGADPYSRGYITPTDWVNWLQQTTYITLAELSKGLRHKYAEQQDSEMDTPSTPEPPSAPPSSSRVPGKRVSVVHIADLESPHKPQYAALEHAPSSARRPRLRLSRSAEVVRSTSAGVGALSGAAFARRRRPETAPWASVYPDAPPAAQQAGAEPQPGARPIVRQPWGAVPGLAGPLPGNALAGGRRDRQRPARRTDTTRDSERPDPGPPFHPDFLTLGIVRRYADLNALLPPALRGRRAAAPKGC